MTEWLAASLAASLVGCVILGILLWRETSRRADTETRLNLKLTENVKLRINLAAERLISDNKEGRIRELEARLPPAARFDELFTPRTPDDNND